MLDFEYVECIFNSPFYSYTYKVLKRWRVKEGSYLVVPTPDGFSVVKVIEVSDKTTYKGGIRWAVQKVTFGTYRYLIKNDL